MHRRFDVEDQESFASLSGDYNPLHTDPALARRLLFGDVVVHGIHLVLWALDSRCAEQSAFASLAWIKGSFLHPVFLGERVTVEMTREASSGRERFEIKVEDATRAVVLCGWEPVSEVLREDRFPPSPGRTESGVLTFQEASEAAGAVPLFLDSDPVSEMFPHLPACLPARQIASLLAMTRIVGMECPGFHSLFVGLDLKFNNEGPPPVDLTYRTTLARRDVSLIQVKVESPSVAGTLKTFYRPPKVEQAGVREMSALVKPDEFAGQRAFVVGGSRGVGEVTAKILGAGGADVLVSYHQGRGEAEKIVEDIRRGGGTADAVRYDVLGSPEDQGPAFPGGRAPSHLYYFATPSIFGKAGALAAGFDEAHHKRFNAFYVDGFSRLVFSLTRAGTQPLNVLYPSTVMLDAFDGKSYEYCTAKAAGETLCRLLEESIEGLSVHVRRLPGIKTDQLASVIPVSCQDPVEVMLPILRDMNARGESRPKPLP